MRPRPIPRKREGGRWPPSRTRGNFTSARLSWCSGGNGADLLEHAERVPVRPFLYELSVLEPRQVDPLHHDVLAGRWDAHDLAGVAPASLPPRCDRVAVTDLVLDLDVRTLERFAVLVEVVLDSLRPADRLRQSRVVAHVVSADKLVDYGGVLPDVFEHLPDDLLVASRHRTSLSSLGRSDSTPVLGSRSIARSRWRHDHSSVDG